MARPRIRSLISVNCAYCNRPLTRAEGRNQYTKNKRHFCNQTCYWSWLKELQPTEEIRRKYTQDDLLVELQHVAHQLGYLPTVEEMIEHGNIYPSVYEKRFGTWGKALSLIQDPLPKFNQWNIDDVSPEDGSWLSGLIDGEGCFRMQRPSPSNESKLSRSFSTIFAISLRADDEKCLRETQRIIGFTNSFHMDMRLYEPENSNANPVYKINLRDIPILAYRLIPILDKYPLRSKKANDFILFKMAVKILLDKRQSDRKQKAYLDSERLMLENLYHALHEIKAFHTELPKICQKYGIALNY